MIGHVWLGLLLIFVSLESSYAYDRNKCKYQNVTKYECLNGNCICGWCPLLPGKDIGNCFVYDSNPEINTELCGQKIAVIHSNYHTEYCQSLYWLVDTIIGLILTSAMICGLAIMIWVLIRFLRSMNQPVSHIRSDKYIYSDQNNGF